MPICLRIVYGSFHASGLSGCDRTYMGQKPKILPVWSFTERTLLTSFVVVTGMVNMDYVARLLVCSAGFT